VNVVQEWRIKIFAYLVISTTNDNEGLIEWQESHGVTNSSTGWISLLLYFLPFSRHYFALDAVRLQVFELGQELSF
jgi:hypothetical protein